MHFAKENKGDTFLQIIDLNFPLLSILDMAQISLINIKESGRRINKIRIACDTVAAAKAAFKSVQSGISKLR